MRPELQAAFDNFDWDGYFAKINNNPANIHAYCDHAYGYCAATPSNTYEGIAK